MFKIILISGLYLSLRVYMLKGHRKMGSCYSNTYFQGRYSPKTRYGAVTTPFPFPHILYVFTRRKHYLSCIWKGTEVYFSSHMDKKLGSTAIWLAWPQISYPSQIHFRSRKISIRDGKRRDDCTARVSCMYRGKNDDNTDVLHPLHTKEYFI